MPRSKLQASDVEHVSGLLSKALLSMHQDDGAMDDSSAEHDMEKRRFNAWAGKRSRLEKRRFNAWAGR